MGFSPDPDQYDIQIVHVHGTYWFYDCCNLREEIKDRSLSSSPINQSMASLLNQIFEHRSPLVLGYSGWEDDVIMSALRRRLERRLPYKLYWFCFRESEIKVLPKWIQDNQNVVFVVQPRELQTSSDRASMLLDTTKMVQSVDVVTSGYAIDNGEIERTLPAHQVLDTFIEMFHLEVPGLVNDPLAFLAEQLEKSLPSGEALMGGSDLYFVRSVIKRIKIAKEREAETIQQAEKQLEDIRNSIRRSRYEVAIDQAASVDLSNLGVQAKRDFLLVITEVSGQTFDDPAKNITCNDLTIEVCRMLLEDGVPEASELCVLINQALLSKALVLDGLHKHDEEIDVYDEIISRTSLVSDSVQQRQRLGAIFNKAITLHNDDKLKEALAMFDLVLTEFSQNSTQGFSSDIAKVLVNKGVTLLEDNQPMPANELFRDMINQFQSNQEATVQAQIAVAMINRGRALGRLGLAAEEIKIYDEVLQHFGDQDQLSFKIKVAVALLNKGIRLMDVDRLDEAEETIERLLDLTNGEDEKALTSILAEAFLCKGDIFRFKDKIEAALSIYDELINRFRDDKRPECQEVVASALNKKGSIHNNLSQRQLEIEAYNAVESLYGNEPALSVKVQVAVALRNKYETLFDADPDEARQVYETLKSKYGMADEQVLRNYCDDTE